MKDEKKYLDPDQNPAIPKEEATDKDNRGLPFVGTPKINIEDLAKRINEKYPTEDVIMIDPETQLIIQKDKSLEIKKIAEDGSATFDPFSNGKPEDLSLVDDFVRGNKTYDPMIDPKNNPAIPDHDE